MTDSDTAIEERLAAIETDIKHILNSTARIARIKSRVARIEKIVAREKTEGIDAGFMRIANIINKETMAIYFMCGAIIVGIVAVLL